MTLATEPKIKATLLQKLNKRQNWKECIREKNRFSILLHPGRKNDPAPKVFFSPTDVASFFKKRLRLFVYQCNSWICECWRLRACVCVKGEERQCACVCVGVCVCDRESAAWGSVTCILDHMCHFLHREKKILRNNWKDAPTFLNIKNQNSLQLVNSFSTKAIEESSLAAPTQQSLREVNWHLRLKVRIDVLLGS